MLMLYYNTYTKNKNNLLLFSLVYHTYVYYTFYEHIIFKIKLILKLAH